MSELTVIIPTWNQTELLIHCLQSLRKQTVPCHILVVDNGSTDSTRGMIEAQRQAFPGILDCIQLERNFGFSRATNEGITAAQTQFIPLLNNDTEADPTGSKPVFMLLKTSTDSPFLLQRSFIFHYRNLLDCARDCYSQAGIPYKKRIR